MSKVARRMNVARSLAGAGNIPFASRAARINRSMGVRIQSFFLTRGSGGRSKGRVAHQSLTSVLASALGKGGAGSKKLASGNGPFRRRSKDLLNQRGDTPIRIARLNGTTFSIRN